MKKSIMFAAAALLAAGTASATVHMTENFESYANQAALEAVWVPTVVTDVPQLTVSAGQGAGASNNYVTAPATGTASLVRTLGAGVSLTEGTALVLKVNFRSADWGNSRASVSMRDTGTTAAPLIGIGTWNNTVGNPAAATALGNFFAARVVGVTGSGISTDSNYVGLTLTGPGIARAVSTWQEVTIVVARGLDAAPNTSYIRGLVNNNLAFDSQGLNVTITNAIGAVRIGAGVTASKVWDVDSIEFSDVAPTPNASDVQDWDIY